MRPSSPPERSRTDHLSSAPGFTIPAQSPPLTFDTRPGTRPPATGYTIPTQTPPAEDDTAFGAANAPGRIGRRIGRDGGPWADLEGGFEPDDRANDLITPYPAARPGPAGAIHGVGITVLVTNLERSIAFYRDVLGFFEIDSGTASAVLASGDTRLVLRTVHDLSAEAGRLIYLNLEVGDVEAVYAELKAKGVNFVHAPRPVNRGDKLELWAASFSDPDKHNIAITQWRAIR